MKITRSGAQTGHGPADNFSGDVYIDTIKNPDEQSAIGCAHVRFTPGARTAWHHHPKGQTLYVTDGIGLVCYRGGTAIEIRPGDVVYIEPGEEHPPTASWPTSPCRKPTTKARSSLGWSTSTTTSTTARGSTLSSTADNESGEPVRLLACEVVTRCDAADQRRARTPIQGSDLRLCSPGWNRTIVASPDSKSGGPCQQTNRGSTRKG